MYNALFMDLPMSSFVFHSSSLKAKCVNLVVALDGFLSLMEIVHIFMKVVFEQFLIHNAV